MKRKTLIGISMLLLIILSSIAFSLTYNEKPTKPSMTDNSYAIAVSNFIKEKCGNCKDVMIVGDDFVVPQYRNKFKVDKTWLPLLNKINQYNIYTDQPYRMVTGIPQINELDLIFTQKGRVQDKQVMFIVPDDIDSELRASIDNLKNIIKTKFKTDDIPEKKGSELIIGDYGVPGTTLVIIGNLENNPTMRYYPFALSNDYDMWIDRNLWDPNRGLFQKEEYALILKIDSSYEIDLAAGIINSEFYKEVNGEGINWVALGGGALLIIVSPFTGPLAPFVAAAGIAVLSADTVDNCLIENQAGQNWDECGGDIALDIATAGIFKLIKPLAKPIVEKFGKAVGEKIIALINKLGQYIDPKAISKVAKEGDELVNMKYMTDGAEVLTKSSDGSLGKALNELPESMDQVAKARFVKGIGEFANGIKAIQWEDAAAKGTKNDGELLGRLGESAKKVYTESINPGGGAAEATVAENFFKRGATLEYTEKALQKAANGGEHLDMVVKIGNKLRGIEVKGFPERPPISVGEAEYGIKNIFHKFLEKTGNLPAGDYGDNILQIVVKNQNEADNILKAATNLQAAEPSMWQNVQLIVKIVEGWMIK